MKQILVLGSLNGDLVQRVPRIPGPGETLAGGGLQTFIGGKGANQACAAALLGGKVQMAGKVGADVFGNRLLEGVMQAGVDVSRIERSDAPSGTAVIFVLPSGENAIVIAAGANADVSVNFALKAVDHLGSDDLLLCQLETPLDAVAAALTAAREKGVVTILDPAPGCCLPDEMLAATAILTPNQTEAALLLGTSDPPQTIADAERAAKQLQARGAETVIVKMGEQGCVLASPGGCEAIPGFLVTAVDTTAAGDTFNGALAVALANGAALREAATFANAGAALSVTRPGASASVPSLTEVQQFLAARRSVS